MNYRGGRDAGRDDINPNKIELGEPRVFGGMEGEKPDREDTEDRFPKFDASRGGRRPPFGRGRRPSPSRDKPFGDNRPREFGGFGRDDSNARDRSPMRGGMDDRFSDRFKKDEGGFHKREDMGRKDSSGRPFFGDDNFRDRYPEGGRSRFDQPAGFNPRFDSRDDQFKNRPFNYPNVPPKGYYNEGFPKPNECEIIVVNKQQRLYAESVEARIKNLGVLVDILFLKDEALLTQTVDDIARRGSLFAMVINPQNETHGSVTVNILHGTPQEHRNMPLDDALKLVARNFHDHIRMQKENMEREKAERGPYVGMVPADREIQLLLRMLADGRWVSQPEINNVIRYLTERRDKMQNSQGDRAPMPQAGDIKLDVPLPAKNEADVAQKEQDLQNRIINLMSQGAPPVGSPGKPSDNSGLGSNQNAGPNAPGIRQSQPGMGPNMVGMRSSQSPMGPNATGVSPNQSAMRPMQPGIDDNQPIPSGVGRNQAGTPTNLAGKPGSGLPNEPASSATYINFDNPSVQKALDNLMQSGPNLLKNITMSSTVPTSSAQNTTPKTQNSNMGGMGPPSPRSALDAPGPRPGVGPSRGLGGAADMVGMGPPRGSGNMMDMGGGGMGPQRGSGNMSDMGGMSARGPGMGNMGPPRGGMSDMGGMGPQRGGNMGPPQGPGHGHANMGQHGSNFPGPNQHNFPGSNQGNFPGTGPYGGGSNMMGNMPRQNYGGGGNQGPMMGGMGGPRRY